MSRESNDGHVCPKCETTIYLEQCACDPSDDGLGHDLMQSWLEVAYSRLMLNSTRNLVGHLQQSSPLLGVHKLDVSWSDL